tara:strand:+ start:533 stop:838 length:306 start_codon:yes stop_codon:yes gene_type:complete
MLSTKLRTRELQEIKDKLHTNKPWLDLLISVLLAKVEEYLYESIVNARVKEEVSQAIQEYHEVMDEVEPMVAPPVYSERFTDASTSLPEMRLTAPWADTSK